MRFLTSFYGANAIKHTPLDMRCWFVFSLIPALFHKPFFSRWIFNIHESHESDLVLQVSLTFVRFCHCPVRIRSPHIVEILLYLQLLL